MIAALIRSAVLVNRDEELWAEAVRKEEEGREQLELAAEQWGAVVEFIDPAA